MKRFLIWSLVMVPAFLPAMGQTVNPANQINWPLVTGSGTPASSCTAANYGQPYTDTSANPNQNYTCGSHGWALSGSGGGGGSSFTSNVGVGANNSATYGAVNEVNYKTTSGNTAFACQEDQNKGIWDVRCIRSGVSFFSNPSQAIINTIQAAECYHFTGAGPLQFTVQLPSGSYIVGGNIKIPPGADLEGTGGTEYGSLTQLTTNDETKPMFTQSGSETYTCSGTPHTVTNGTVTIGNLSLNGRGTLNPNDSGIVNSTGGTSNAYIHNISLQNFGGPGRKAISNGQNSRGEHIFFAADLQWYYFSGSYNPTSFADTTPHCSLEIQDLDSTWDHVEGFGQLQDTGYYNRYYLSNVCMGGNFADKLTDSFIQIAPHNVWVVATSNGGQQILRNRFDDAWWDSIHVGSPGDYSENIIDGFCTSPTLNPANFPTNPGGVSTDPNCAAIEVYDDAGLGSTIRYNSIGQVTGLWPAWPVYGIWVSQNVLNAPATVIDQPGAPPGSIGGPVGGDSGAGNVGTDIVRSLYQTTSGNHTNAGGAIHFKGFAHTYLNDTSPSNYTTFDGAFPDTYLTVGLLGTDTITPGSGIVTCSGSPITSGIHWFYTIDGSTSLVELCPSGSGGGGGGTISGLTAGFLPLAGSATSLTGNSPLDYGISNAGIVTVTKPFAVNDGTGLGGVFDGAEGTPPSGAASHDILWADATSHDLKMNNNNGGAANIVGIVTAGASGDNVRLGTGGKNIISVGPPASSFTPTFTPGTGAGTSPTISFTSGANDESGWINVTTGTSPAASAGIVTISYGGTYANIRKCSVDPANGAAGILTTSGRPYVPVSTSTTTQFVITVGTTALTASTTYQWIYRCGT